MPRVVTIGLATATLLLGLAACSSGESESDSPALPDPGPSLTSPPVGTSPPVDPETAEGALEGAEVLIEVLARPGGVLAVDDKGQAILAGEGAAKDAFTLTAVESKYQIKSASGRVACLGRHAGTDDRPDTLVAATCDINKAGQLFTLDEQDRPDAQGRATYSIEVEGLILKTSDQFGLYAQEEGDTGQAAVFRLTPR